MSNNFRLPILLQSLHEIFWICVRGEPLHRLSILVDDKLGEVPFDEVTKYPTLFVLQIFIQRMSVRTVDVDLLENIKLHFVPLDEGADLLAGPGLLAGELVTRERQNPQPLALRILVVQLHQLRVIVLGESTLGRHVDDDAYVIPVFLQRHFFALDVLGGELVNRFCILVIFRVRHFYDCPMELESSN